VLASLSHLTHRRGKQQANNKEQHTMAEEGQFFRPVKDFCQRTVVTCKPDDALVDVVGIMREKNISSVVVCDQKLPSGIITDRDLRNKVVASGVDPSTLTVRAIMNSPLAVIGEDDLLYEALYRMSRKRFIAWQWSMARADSPESSPTATSSACNRTRRINWSSTSKQPRTSTK
jgi:CBS domain-containing protein